MPGNPKFQRNLNPATIANLSKERLFVERLLPDIKKGVVFPAFRSSNKVDFYHSGGRLFAYSYKPRTGKGTFETHVKYTAVLLGHKGHYITEAKLQSARLPAHFRDSEAYKRIKENCRLYSGDEAKGVASLYSHSSYASCKDNVLVLDIEIDLGALKATGKGEPTDRIDLLLYNIPKRTLRFYEAKHFSNSELWSQKGKKPKVVRQLRRYNTLLKDSKKRESILNAYEKYVATANELFGLSVPPPQELEDSAVLLLYGYDRTQTEKIRNELLSDGSLRGYRLRQRGNVKAKGSTAEVIWKNVKSL